MNQNQLLSAVIYYFSAITYCSILSHAKFLLDSFKKALLTICSNGVFLHSGPQEEVGLLLQCCGAGEESSSQPEQLPTSRLILAVVVGQLLQDLTVNLIPQRFLKRST